MNKYRAGIVAISVMLIHACGSGAIEPREDSMEKYMYGVVRSSYGGILEFCGKTVRSLLR